MWLTSDCNLFLSTNVNAYFLSAKLRDRCPFPTGVISGPLRPTLFLLTDSMAVGGMPNFPSGPLTGVTSTTSHWRGT